MHHSTNSNSSFRGTLAYLNVDFETTGLDENLDSIVEVGIIGTDSDYNPLFEIETLIHPTALTFNAIEATPIVKEMMTANGLLDDLRIGADTGLYPSIRDVEDDLLALINRHSPSEQHKVVLSGSGVATFDFRFIRTNWPKIAARLEYWPDDVGVLRRKWRTATGDDLVPDNKSKTHRAFDDIQCHLSESRQFRDLFTRIGALAGGGDLDTVTAWLDEVEAARQLVSR
jgi:oligoribonuclease